MGTVTVKIPSITWRDGRPRFNPGPRLRRLGLKGEDLRHPDGQWFDLSQAIAWSAEREKLIAQLDAAPARSRKTVLATATGGNLTVGQLLELWLQLPRMRGQELVEGKRRRLPLSPNTVRFYRNAANQLAALDEGRIWLSSAAAITPKVFEGVVHKVEVKHGLATARALRATLSAAYRWGRGAGKTTADPVGRSELELPTLPPRIRYGSIAEMQSLVAAADAIGRPEIGDSIMLGLWTGQRQGDRLALTDGKITSNGILFHQHKKGGQPLLIPQAPELAVRLKGALVRRRDWRVNYPHVVLDEALKRPFDEHRYRKIFRLVRDAAVKGGEGRAPCASLADFHDQDLRDTAVTWLALAGVDKIRIASVTGHSLKSVDEILKHYLGMHPELARSAIASLVDWYDEEVKK